MMTGLLNELRIKEDDGGAPSPAREARALPDMPLSSDLIQYSKRRLPHFERPWAKYAVSFSTFGRVNLSSSERDVVMQSAVYGHDRGQYELYAACVMPDHVHLLPEPQIKGREETGAATFWALGKILQGIKSASAHRIATKRGVRGALWNKESFDRVIRSESDLHEKFHYICRNPWVSGVVRSNEEYQWLWTPDYEGIVTSNPGSARASRAAFGASPKDFEN